MKTKADLSGKIEEAVHTLRSAGFVVSLPSDSARCTIVADGVEYIWKDDGERRFVIRTEGVELDLSKSVLVREIHDAGGFITFVLSTQRPIRVRASGRIIDEQNNMEIRF